MLNPRLEFQEKVVDSCGHRFFNLRSETGLQLLESRLEFLGGSRLDIGKTNDIVVNGDGNVFVTPVILTKDVP